jgi:hypothetical protein
VSDAEKTPSAHAVASSVTSWAPPEDYAAWSSSVVMSEQLRCMRLLGALHLIPCGAGGVQPLEARPYRSVAVGYPRKETDATVCRTCSRSVCWTTASISVSRGCVALVAAQLQRPPELRSTLRRRHNDKDKTYMVLQIS